MSRTIVGYSTRRVLIPPCSHQLTAKMFWKKGYVLPKPIMGKNPDKGKL
jgi:hypothetical protein